MLSCSIFLKNLDFYIIYSTVCIHQKYCLNVVLIIVNHLVAIFTWKDDIDKILSELEKMKRDSISLLSCSILS